MEHGGRIPSTLTAKMRDLDPAGLGGRAAPRDG